MAKSERRLGRGLSSLIQVTSAPPRAAEGTVREEGVGAAMDREARIAGATATLGAMRTSEHAIPVREAAEETWAAKAADPAMLQRGVGDARWVRVDEIEASSQQPRRQFDAQSIAQLAASIVRNGLVQPLVIRPARDGRNGAQPTVKYELVAGERRWRASRAAGLERVPAILREVDDERALELALIENLQREDLNAMDRAEAYARYCRQFGLKPEEVASRLSEDRTTVVNYLRLLELPEQVKELVAGGTLSMGHARALLGLADAGSRVDLARSVVVNGLSVRALEDIVRRRRVGGTGDRVSAAASTSTVAGRGESTPQVAHVESCFQQALGTKVKIRPGRGKGRGQIVIEYYSFDDFDRIAARLGVDLD